MKTPFPQHEPTLSDEEYTAEMESAISIKDALVAHAKRFGRNRVIALWEVFHEMFLTPGAKHEIK